MTGSVHVVIVNWNTGAYLRRSLESMVRAVRAGAEVELVTVVDNASSDGSATGLEDLAAELRLEVIRNTSNAGFAAACNQGAARGDAPFLLFLNPDTLMRENAIPIVTDFMNSDRAADVGICGVQLVDDQGRPAFSCARFPTVRIMFGKMTRLDRVAPRLFPSHHLTAAELHESGFVDQVIGAFYFVRRSLFLRLGGFDTRYFVYYEEVDFALRARRLGWRSYFLREATIEHAESVSAGQVRDLRLYYSLRSRLIFARRHWGRHRAIAMTVLTFAVELPARLGMAALRGDWSDVASTARAYRMLAGDLSSLAGVLAAG